MGRNVGNAREDSGEERGEERGERRGEQGRYGRDPRRPSGNPGERRGEQSGERSGRGVGRTAEPPKDLRRVLYQTIIQIGSDHSETLTNRINHMLGSSPPARMHVRAVVGIWVGGCA